MILEAVDKGFDPRGRLTFNVVMPAARFPDAASMRASNRRVVDALTARLEFSAVGTTTAFPLTGQDLENGFSVDGYVPPAPDQGPVAAMRGVSPGYLEAMGIPTRAGRALRPTDDERGARVVVINESFVRRYFNGRDPIGGRVSEGGPEAGWRTVVGVAADVKHHVPAAEACPEVLIPYLQLDAGTSKTPVSRCRSVIRWARVQPMPPSSSRLQREQQLTSLRELEIGITAQIREAALQVTNSLQRVEATRKAREFAEKRYEAEQKRVTAGLSTTFQLVNAQQALSNARLSETNAIIDYNVALVAFTSLQTSPR